MSYCWFNREELLQKSTRDILTKVVKKELLIMIKQIQKF